MTSRQNAKETSGKTEQKKSGQVPRALPEIEGLIKGVLAKEHQLVEFVRVRGRNEVISGFIKSRGVHSDQTFLQDFEVKAAPDGSIEYLEIGGRRLISRSGPA